MADSILTDIKKRLGLGEEYTPFDPDVIMDINAAFMTLRQLGVGADKGFSISGYEETWGQYLDGLRVDLEAVKMFIALKVRLSFDPPSSSFVIDSIQRQLDELEWRLNIQVEEGGSHE